ncbi:hypothetical protein [uncultured Amaricoccus sp.]|uniref:hypothetical protein n=1 Tax=uncultured Amaricoccus sp. TaxID=339341 RepID=UPI0026327647|nr:hypothetical protein [uncultured Amaricoccus sp.]
MSDFSSRPALSAHEVLRFSIEHARMRVRHVGLHHDRVSISLRDHSPQQNLWELMQIRDTVRLTRFPKLHPPSFDGPTSNRFESCITPELFARILATHRSAIVQKIQDLVARLNEDRAGVPGLNEEVATAVDDRLREILQVARRLFPGDFPE